MKITFCMLATAVFSMLQSAAVEGAWKPAEGPLKTRWAAAVCPQNALPEYPRPQLVREQWQNLNGLWHIFIGPRDGAQPAAFDSASILVPFPAESALSSVGRRVSENDRMWYRRQFRVPRDWSGKRVILHFGAVDFEARVLVNGKEQGTHRGGYEAFSFDITDSLHPGMNEMVVSVWDPTDGGTQPRGKQVRSPKGIWYTPASGIWQTVWLEPVSAAHIEGLKITPDVDGGAVLVEAITPALLGDYRLEVTVRDRGTKVGVATLQPGREARLPISKPKLWSPESPFLYDLAVSLNLGSHRVDSVRSYFGMRKISLGKDDRGFTRLLLNNKPYFQFGPLDQGFWPDGIYTAPTDDALRSDIEMTKRLGFNMARKHVKIEPDRWYYWCDKLGLLVWQDMPSGDIQRSGQKPSMMRSAESGHQYEEELGGMVAGLYNHPSIVVWVPYNEGWGQWDTARISGMVKRLDPSRLVNSASGWVDQGCGDINDIHKYPGPAAPEPERNRASVLGEFGGLGFPMPGHTWQAEKNWGYRSYPDRQKLQEAYLDLVAKLFPLIQEKGLSAAVYTQTTDVEIEVNGFMTYDRGVVKMDPRTIREANRGWMNRR